MSKYHASTKSGLPLCGANGSARGFHVVTLPAKDWNELHHDSRCAKCVAKIQKMKQVKAANNQGEENEQGT